MGGFMVPCDLVIVYLDVVLSFLSNSLHIVYPWLVFFNVFELRGSPFWAFWYADLLDWESLPPNFALSFSSFHVLPVLGGLLTFSSLQWPR